MIVDAVFHIYKSFENEDNYVLDGRLLSKIKLSDELIMIKHVDIDFYIRNCNRDGSLTVDDMIQFEKVHINKIFSYGNIWEELPMGMSARLECLGNIENSDDLVLLRITKA